MQVMTSPHHQVSRGGGGRTAGPAGCPSGPGPAWTPAAGRRRTRRAAGRFVCAGPGATHFPSHPTPQTKRSILCALLFCVCLSVCLRVRARVCAHACVCMSEHTQMCMNTSKLTCTHTQENTAHHNRHTQRHGFLTIPRGANSGTFGLARKMLADPRPKGLLAGTGPA